MAVQKIDYENKIGLQNDENVPNKNKVTDEDMNQIKSKVNNNADELSTAQQNIEDLQEGQGTASSEITSLENRVTTLEKDNTKNKQDIANKVDKVEGKGLSTEDYTTAEKEKLAGLNNYDDTEIKQDIQEINEDISDIKTEQETQNDLLQRTQNALINITTPKSSNINVKDSSDLNAKIDVYGISEQETREGYNKFDYDAIEGLAGSTTKTNINGLKVYKRTSIQQNIWPLFNLNDVLENGKTYTMCFDVWADEQTTFNNQTLYVNSSIRVKHNLSNITTAKQKLIANFTYTKNDSNAIIHIYPTTSETNNFYIANVMLLEGTFTSENIPEFEQYGASPSPEYKSDIENVEGNVDITVCNKNLFTGFVKGKGINSSTGEELQRDTSAVSDFINVDFNKVTNYYLSGLTDRLNSYIAAYSKDKKFLGRTNANPVNFFILNKDSFFQYKNEGNIAFIRITQYVIETSTGTINDIDNLKVQLEIGNTLTDYIEHEQQTITFPLAEGQKLADGDYLADDGIHHKRKQIELDGTENWVLSGSIANNQYALEIPDIKIIGETSKGNLISSHFKEITGVEGYQNNNINGISGWSLKQIRISLDINIVNRNVTEFKNLLAQQKQTGTPVIVEYKLEEEIVEPYTPEQQKAYNQLQNVLSYYNETNVFTDKAQLVFKYIADTQTWTVNLVKNEIANTNQQILEIAGGN